MWKNVQIQKRPAEAYQTKAWLRNMPQVFTEWMNSSNMPIYSQKSKCIQCTTNNRTSYNTSGFSQPSHHRASGVEPGSGPGTQSPSSVKSVGKSPGRNQEDYNTSDRITNERDASSNPGSSSSSLKPHSTINTDTEKNKHSHIVLNYSSYELSEAMLNLLNRA